MQSIRSIVFTILGLIVAVASFVFAASLGLALAGILAVLMLGSSLAARLTQRPVRATAQARSDHGKGGIRVWNDGRGTIIDM